MCSGGEYDGEQTWPRAAVYSLDKPDLVQVRAPKATQVLLTTEDNCFPFAGGNQSARNTSGIWLPDVGQISDIFVWAGQRAVEESLPAFHAMGKAEALNVSIGEYHHGWCNKNREAMYAFFASNLGNSEASSEEWWPSGFGNLSALFDASQLQVTSTGQVRTAPECKVK